jgi:hypothetical protein
MTASSWTEADKILKELIDASDALFKAEDTYNETRISFSRGKGKPPSLAAVGRQLSKFSAAKAAARSYLATKAIR